MSDNREQEEEETLSKDEVAGTSDVEITPEDVEAAEEDVIDELFLSPDESSVVEVTPDEVVQPDAVAFDPTATPEYAALAEERDDYKNRMLRAAADLENFRRRSAREKEDLRQYGIDGVIKELLPVLDNLDRAVEHAEKEGESTLLEGVRMVQRQFVGALQKHGVVGFDSKGELFDPTKHEAIQQYETTEHPHNTVVEEFQRGYFLHDRLIRPALVVVARNVAPVAAVKDDAVEIVPDDNSDSSDGTSEPTIN